MPQSNRRLQKPNDSERKLGLGFFLSSVHNQLSRVIATMIYDVNSPLFRSFLSQKGGSSDKRKLEEQKPKENRPKASENKPVMNE
ncbi:wound-induced basic protein-like [Malus sylvestris]|uniref:wound-induced basic protein-like n=1 Tax=Malus sylvestris TaxID=3752 RepID=UPI0021AC6751|nr:wound-induced basic protein-like [Malus sylvestris]